MTITIETPADLEDTITRAAARVGIMPEEVGIMPEEYVLRAVEKLVREDAATAGGMPLLSLAEAMKPYLGILKGPAGPNDGTGRSWSEIEAPCDPLCYRPHRRVTE